MKRNDNPAILFAVVVALVIAGLCLLTRAAHEEDQQLHVGSAEYFGNDISVWTYDREKMAAVVFEIESKIGRPEWIRFGGTIIYGADVYRITRNRESHLTIHIKD